jgi:hypothetical protein
MVACVSSIADSEAHRTDNDVLTGASDVNPGAGSPFEETAAAAGPAAPPGSPREVKWVPAPPSLRYAGQLAGFDRHYGSLLFAGALRARPGRPGSGVH